GVYHHLDAVPDVVVGRALDEGRPGVPGSRLGAPGRGRRRDADVLLGDLGVGVAVGGGVGVQDPVQLAVGGDEGRVAVEVEGVEGAELGLGGGALTAPGSGGVRGGGAWGFGGGLPGGFEAAQPPARGGPLPEGPPRDPAGPAVGGEDVLVAAGVVELLDAGLD